MKRFREEEAAEGPKKNCDEGFFHKLPDEIVLLIFEKLSDAKNVFIFSLLSKRFADLVPQIRMLSFTVPPPSHWASRNDVRFMVGKEVRSPMAFGDFPKLFKDAIIDSEDPSLSGLLSFISRFDSVEVLKIEFSHGDREISQRPVLSPYYLDEINDDSEKYRVRWKYNLNSSRSRSIVGLAIGDGEKNEELTPISGFYEHYIMDEALTLCVLQPLEDARAMMFFLLRLLNQPSWFAMVTRLKRIEMRHRDSGGNGGLLVVGEEYLIQLKNKKDAKGRDTFANLFENSNLDNAVVVKYRGWFERELRLPQHQVTKNVMQYVITADENDDHENERDYLLKDAFREEEFQLEATMEIAKRPPLVEEISYRDLPREHLLHF